MIPLQPEVPTRWILCSGRVCIWIKHKMQTVSNVSKINTELLILW
jgi:hypothetical protein